MKTNNKLLFILAVVIFLLTACQQFFTKESGNTVAVIVDCSDSFPEIRQNLTLEKLKPRLAITHELYAGSTVLFAKISAIRHNPISIAKIDGAVPANSNTPQREKQREEYYTLLEENIQSITSSPTGTDGSFLLYTIATMLQKLKDSPDSKKGTQLLCFSDLEENNPAVFSVYNKAHLKLLKENPDSAFALFDKEYPIPEAKENSAIYFIHQPKNKEDDSRYTILSTALKKYYQNHGYKVTISATIPEE